MRLLLIICYLHKSNAQELPFAPFNLVDNQQGSIGVSVADFDCNGVLDIVVANQVDSTLLLGNAIYFNHENGFQKSAIANNNLNASSESAHTVDVDNDYDLDGDLDVFVVNRDGEDDNLYANNGRWLFTRVLEGPWIGNKGDGRSCAWGDLNSDQKPDLYVANFVIKENGQFQGKHRNYLYLNSIGGHFEEQKVGKYVEELNASYGVSFIDYYYDKDLDIYITNISIGDVNALNENSGTGVFTKPTDSKVVSNIYRPFKGQTWGDFNNDGWFDLYVANGTEGYPEIQNFLFAGNPDNSFERVYNRLPAIKGHISAGTASGDFDNDGDLDLYVFNWSGDAEANDYYINQNQINRSIKFQLKGRESNSYGIGSWITLTLDDGTVQTRYCSRETGYGSENSPKIQFGIAASAKINAIMVE